MKILITGVNGLLGHEVAKMCCADSNVEVYGIGRSAGLLNDANYNHIVADLVESDFVTKLPRGITAIIHLAQSQKFRDFPREAESIFCVNTTSTLKLLDFARQTGVARFIYASSGGVYGNSDIGFVEDQQIVQDNDLGFYLSTKYCSEQIAVNYQQLFDVVILRFFFVYGERQNRTMLIPRLVDNIRTGKEIVLTGKQGIKINPVYVADAAKAVKGALNLQGSHKINIAGDEVLTIRDISETIAASLGKSPLFRIVDDPPKNLIGDIGKMKKFLWQPRVSFEAGVKKLIHNVNGR